MIGQLPRRFWRYPVGGSLVEQLRDLSPRQQWIVQQSVQRWERRNAGTTVTVSLGEIGTWQGFRIIESP